MQRRAAQALAGETADAQLQQLADDAAVAGASGANAVSTVPGSIGMVPGGSGVTCWLVCNHRSSNVFSPGDFLSQLEVKLLRVKRTSR